MTTDSASLTASKPRFEILDGLRGVAAMLVVAYHLLETYFHDPCLHPLNHGYLAVDFFFMLSGFVIGYAYDERWGRGMSQWNFYKRRLIRLQPMVIMGGLTGAMFYYFGASGAFPMIASVAWWQVLGIMLLAFLMFPTPPALDIRGWAETSALNGPQWSLMWEYLANILYATLIRRFNKTALTLFVLLAAVPLAMLCLNIDSFGLLAGRDALAYTVIGGWSVTADQLYIGISRLLFPFFGGLLIYRLGMRIRFAKRGFLLCSLMLAAILCFPHMGGATPNMGNGVYILVAIALLFPIIVMAGAGRPLKGAKTTRVCQFLGAISYPLYITHYPLIYMQIAWVDRNPDAPLGTNIFVGVSIFFMALGIAYASLRLYDEPVREWLKNHWLYASKAKGARGK